MPSLDWIGKSAVLNHHREVPYHLLRCDPKLSVGDPGSGNLLVHGDNLLALKALLPYYAGQVKCIYIDPPYNTGNESWVYNDAVNSPEILAWLGRTVGREAEDLTRHDKWLCMMYPRLALLRKFLHRDGSIWVSMGDTSIANLRLLMDELFDPSRFVATIVWQKRYSRENRGAIGDVHEYILVYAANPERFKVSRNRIPLTEESAAVYKNPNGDPRGRWRAIPMSAQGFRPNQMYPITTPSGRVMHPPKGRCWSMIEPEFLRLKGEGRIWFGAKGDSAPGTIRYLSEVEGLVPWTWWTHDEVGHTDEAKKEILAFTNEGAAFDTPKPERLMKRIVEVASSPGDLVLDCFAGSGSTGSVAHKMGRRWVMIESAAYARTLIAPRLRSVIEGADEGGITNDVEWKAGGGYQFCELGDRLFDENGSISKPVKYWDLANFLYFMETGEPLQAGSRKQRPFIGESRGVGYYLLSSEAFGDRGATAGSVLTSVVLAGLPAQPGGSLRERVVYGDGCRLSAERLRRERITFKQIPYEIKRC